MSMRHPLLLPTERLDGELQRLQSRTASDLESIRVKQREAYEREIKGLRDTRDLSQGELLKYR
jgi:hypothetical protein